MIIIIFMCLVVVVIFSGQNNVCDVMHFESISTPEKLKNMSYHGGNGIYDLCMEY